jgi:hypothetical protein
MPRYFFHVYDGTEVRDRHGTDLAGPKEARRAAMAAAGAAIRELGDGFWASDGWEMVVTEEGGATVCTLYFSAEC